MTVQKRPDDNIFASSAKSGEVENFPDLTRGWGIAFDQTEGKPPMEWFNALFKRQDEAIRYLLQQGLPEWSATEDYPIHALTRVGAKVYRALSANINKAPATNAVIWKEWGLGADLVLLKENNLSEIKEKGEEAQKAARDNIGAIAVSDIPKVDLTGYVPTTRKINSKSLSKDVSLTATDVGAASANHTHDEYLKIPNNIGSVNTSASSSKNPFAGFGFFNEEVGFNIKYGTLIQAFLLNGGVMSIAQQSVSDVDAPVRLFGRNGTVSADGSAKFGEAVELYHSGNKHSHEIAEINNLKTTLDAKAAANHTHTTAQITGLETALSSKSATNAANIDVASYLNKLGLKEVSLSASGWSKLASGLIIQCVRFRTSGYNNFGTPQYVDLPIMFPNALFFAVGSEDGGNSGAIEVISIDLNRTEKGRIAIYSNYVGEGLILAIGY